MEDIRNDSTPVGVKSVKKVIGCFGGRFIGKS